MVSEDHVELTEEHRRRLGIALNEADLLGIEVDAAGRVAALTFAVLTLPEEGAPPHDRRVQLMLAPVGRVIASLRHGHWDDPAAPVEPFALERMLPVVQSFGGRPIYGWEFFDTPLESFAGYPHRLSLDVEFGQEGHDHTLDVFQDDGDRFLEVRIWFDYLFIRDAQGNPVAGETFISGGERWWDAMHAGDPRTRGTGIYPVGPGPDATVANILKSVSEELADIED